LGNAQALLIQAAQEGHGIRVAVGGGSFEPLVRLAVILGNAPAVIVKFRDPSHTYHCFGISALASVNKLILFSVHSLILFNEIILIIPDVSLAMDVRQIYVLYTSNQNNLYRHMACDREPKTPFF
jgi:hypothetical protein